jgi:ubiquitin-associated SH3 domain-containing protein
MGLSGDEKYSLKIEPSLFEWTGWYGKDGRPDWMTPDELVANGFEVDTTYVPLLSMDQIKPDETVEEYYTRSHELVEHLLAKNGELGMGMDARCLPTQEIK